MYLYLKLLFFIFLFISSPCWALWQPLIGGHGGNNLTGGSTTNYINPAGEGVQTNETIAQVVAPYAGTIQNLNISLGAAPTAGKSYAFTVRKNAVNAAVTCTVSGTNTTCQDITNTVSFIAGDLLSISVVPAGTPAATTAIYSLVARTASNSTNLLMAASNTSTETIALSVGATNYASLSSTSNPTATEYDVSNVMPEAGIIKYLYVSLHVAPGVGTSYAFTVRKNRTTSTSLTCTVSGTNTTCNDTNESHYFSVVAGDSIDIQSVPTSSPTAARLTASVVFETNNPGHFVWLNSTRTGTSSAASTFYTRINANAAGYNTANTAQRQLGPSILANMTNIAAEVSTAPDNGAGTQSYAFTLRDDGNAADTTETCTISETNTSCTANVNATLVTVPKLNTESVPANTPATHKAHISYSGYLFTNEVNIKAANIKGATLQ